MKSVLIVGVAALVGTVLAARGSAARRQDREPAATAVSGRSVVLVEGRRTASLQGLRPETNDYRVRVLDNGARAARARLRRPDQDSGKKKKSDAGRSGRSERDSDRRHRGRSQRAVRQLLHRRARVSGPVPRSEDIRDPFRRSAPTFTRCRARPSPSPAPRVRFATAPGAWRGSCYSTRLKLRQGPGPSVTRRTTLADCDKRRHLPRLDPRGTPRGYSYRSATIGSTRDARRAGR